MEIVSFDSEAYQELVGKIDKIAQYIIQKEDEGTNPKNEVWLDSQELAKLLRISTKTLQRLRKDGLIPYSILRGRCLYRLSDIDKALNDRIIKGDPKTLEEFHRKHIIENGIK